MKFSKQIVFATVSYLVLLLLDFVVTLYSINESGLYTSVFGLKIDMVMTEAELMTTFSLSITMLLYYILWVAFIVLLCTIVSKCRKRKIKAWE